MTLRLRQPRILRDANWPLWTLVGIALLASVPLWGPGIVNTRGGGDSPFLLQRTQQMVANLRAGVFPVRWMPDAAYGLGYPFFNHYSALPYYLAAGFHLLGLDLLTAIKLTQTLGFILAALAMFGWVRDLWHHRTAAWVAAVAYTVAPFHLVNVYVRGDSLSEFYAFVFYPLILWALGRGVRHVVEKRRTWVLDVGALALAYAGLVLSHNISAFIFSPFAALYLVFLVGWARAERPALAPRAPARMVKPLGVGLGGLLLGALLSAWAWLPALLEQGYVQAEMLTGGHFDYARHFRAGDLVQPRLLFNYSVTSPSGGSSPFAMSAAQALVAIVGGIILVAYGLRKGKRTQAFRSAAFLFPLLGLLLATFMLTPLSRPLWDHLPLLAMVQFPWRFLSVQALFGAVAAGAWVLPFKGWRAILVGGGVTVLLAGTTLLPLKPERLPIGPADVTGERLQTFEWFSGNIGTSVRYEWLPEAAYPRPFSSDFLDSSGTEARVIPASGTLESASQLERHPTEQSWHVVTGQEGATLAFPLLYWPGWRGWIDGQAAPVRAIEGAGYLALDVPTGAHTIRLALGLTPLRAGAETASWISALVLLGLLLGYARQSLRSPASSPSIRTQGDERRFAFRIVPSILFTVILLAALLFLVSRSSSPPNRSDDLTMDFGEMVYLHHNPQGVPFTATAAPGEERQARLLSYVYSSEALLPGDSLDVVLKWDVAAMPPQDVAVSLRVTLPAEQVDDQLRLGGFDYTLAESVVPLAAETRHTLQMPENVPRGMYLLQLRLMGPEGQWSPRTPSGAGSGPLYLSPVQVTQGAPVPDRPPVVAQVGPDIQLHAATLEPMPDQAGVLLLQLEWSTLRPLATNYGISVRLLDPEGQQRFARDTQPGYGFTPTSLWHPGERIGDRYVLPLPGDLAPGDGYALVLVLYQFPSLAEIGRTTLGPFAVPVSSQLTFEPPPRSFTLPAAPQPLEIGFAGQAGQEIQLAGYEMAPEGDALALNVWWVAERRPSADYTVFAHLFDPADASHIVAQKDAMPREGAYPTSNWMAGEVVSDTIRLSLEQVPAGSYRLALGLYDSRTGDRLAATTPNGQSLPDNRVVLPDEIEVAGE